jgi:hypothetical protein
MKKVSNVVALTAGILLLIPSLSYAHCDTMNGPVIIDARQALDKKDVTPVLKWVKKGDEAKIKSAFNEAVKTRGKDQKADMRFYETLVKVHRAGEGAKYEGIKPEGTHVEPAIQEADKALQSGQVDVLTRLLADKVTEGVKTRFAEVEERKKHMNDSVEAGREYVKAYVNYVHFVEGLEKMTAKSAEQHHHKH